MSGIMVDPEKLIKFFDRQQEESCGYGYDISTTDELRQFLYDFCHNEVDFGFGFTCKKIEDEEKKEEPIKSETCPKFGSITYPTRDLAQKHLELLRDYICTLGKVSIQDCFRLAEWLQIVPEWTHLHFRSNYGWTDLSTARINTVPGTATDSEGNGLWTLELPVPKKLTRD